MENCHVIYFILTTIYENRNILSSETKKLNSKLDLTGMDDPGYAISKFHLKVWLLYPRWLPLTKINSSTKVNSWMSKTEMNK